MTSKWDIKQYIKKNPDKFPYLYKEEEDALYGKDDNKYICSLDTFLEVFRKKQGNLLSVYTTNMFRYFLLLDVLSVVRLYLPTTMKIMNLV